jgi:hypothetical protein
MNVFSSLDAGDGVVRVMPSSKAAVALAFCGW